MCTYFENTKRTLPRRKTPVWHNPAALLSQRWQRRGLCCQSTNGCKIIMVQPDTIPTKIPPFQRNTSVVTLSSQGAAHTHTHIIASLNAQCRQVNCLVEMAPSAVSAPSRRPPRHLVEFDGFPSRDEFNGSRGRGSCPQWIRQHCRSWIRPCNRSLYIEGSLWCLCFVPFKFFKFWKWEKSNQDIKLL